MATSTGSGTGIQFSGLFSGLDTENIIKQLVYLDSAPKRNLQTKQTMLGLQKDALQVVNTSLLSLKSSIKDFSNGLLLSNKAVSDDENVATASADSSASQGVYTVSVNQMAYAHRIGSAAQAAAYGGASGAFTVTIGASVFTVNIATGDSMEAIAGKINNSVDGASANFMTKGLATVITDPGTGNKTIVIDSKTTGTANAITVSTTAQTTALGLDTASNQTLQAAQNADVTINGVNITNSTNSITGAIFGVTLNIEGFGSANITVGPDDDEIVSKVKSFVDQFNSSTDLLASYASEKKIPNATTAATMQIGILQNDSDLSQAKSDIRIKTTGYIDNTQTTYKILSSIGIDSESMVGSTVSDNITLDEDKLRAALKDDKTQVSDLLQGFADNMNTYLESQTKVTVAESMAGNFYRRILSIDTQVNNIGDELTNWDEKIAQIEQRYRDQFSAMEQFMQQLQTQGNYLTNQLNNLSGNSQKK